MTILTDSELAEIANNNFNLDFVQARLVQQASAQPRMYEGSGSVFQDASGKLQLKLYCRVENAEEEFSAAFIGQTLTPGQLVGPDHYYSFEGVDLTGQTWTASDIAIDVQTGVSAGGSVVCARRLRQIQSDSVLTSVSNEQAVLIVPGTFRVPFTHAQPGTGEKGLSACTLELGDAATASVKTKDGALIVVLTLTNQNSKDYTLRVLEALGIAIGALLRPQVEVILANGQRRQVVSSLGNDAARSHALVPAVPTGDRKSFRDFQAFVVKFLAAFSGPYDQLAGYWFRVLSAFGNSLENQALVLTTAIEGVLKAYFPKEAKPDAEYLRQLAETKPVVRELTIGQRAQQQLLNSLGNAKKPTAANALHALETQGRIPQNLRNVWKDLRNKMSHADELQWDDAKSQLFINDVYGCLELFYRLVMLHIGYEGRVTSFSKVGWPEESLTAFKHGVASTAAGQVVQPSIS